MKRTILSAFALAALVSADFRPAVAELQDAMQLSAVQVTALDEIQDELRNDVRPVINDLRAAQRELRNLQGNTEPDRNVVQMIEARIENSQGWMDTLRARAVAQARSTLTPEQTAFVDALALDTAKSALAMQAVRYNLLERSQIELQALPSSRANQGDFRSDGQRR